MTNENFDNNFEDYEDMNDDKFQEWIETATDDDKRLLERVQSFRDLFLDMIFDSKSSTSKFTSCQINISEDESTDVIPLPDQLVYFSYNFFTYKAVRINKTYEGAFNYKEKVLAVPPENLDNDIIILHEMIHMHESVIDKLPLFYHDTLLWILYCDLKSKIENLDTKISGHAHLLSQKYFYDQGGVHDVLFLLKSFDLDLKKGYPIGTVIGFGSVEFFKDKDDMKK